jgi:hypothetical protein
MQIRMRAGNPSRRRVARLGLALALAVVATWTLARQGQPDAPGPPEQPPGLADLWSGRASPVLDRRWTSTSLGMPGGGAAGGARLAVAGGAWYLFNRFAWPHPGCPGGTALGTQVRVSTDRGASWSLPVPIVAPSPGTPWACAATDGDAVYDATAGVWRFVFQCMGEAGGWNGCYAERPGADPLGPFAAPNGVANPVIGGGQLWSRICASAADRCHGGFVHDEGTFALLPAASGWWVSFHGYDGVHGYRGIARTTTFRRGDWQVDGVDGTPTDAVLTARDAAGWRESWGPGGPIGPGAAALLAEGGWYYQLAEFADRNLGCTPGQNWDLGLFRAGSLASTHWEQYPAGNPIVYSSRAPDATGVSGACNVEYPGLVHDPATGTTYLMYGRRSSDPLGDGIALYRIEWDRNLLVNGDFWRADVEGWHASPGTASQIAAQRLPDQSPDGTPWLSLDCGGGPCGPGAGVYQDVAVPDRLRGRPLAFGGSFRVDAGSGRLDVVLVQLDAGGHTIRSDAIRMIATTVYAAVRQVVEIDGRARRLRFQLSPHGSAGFGADDLLAIPQDGCSAPRYPAC